MEVTSRPPLCPGGCSERPQPWGAGSFMRVEGQKARGVIGGGCSPVLPRIHPHQLQIKGVDTVTLEEDGAPGHPGPSSDAPLLIWPRLAPGTDLRPHH